MNSRLSYGVAVDYEHDIYDFVAGRHPVARRNKQSKRVNFRMWDLGVEKLHKVWCLGHQTFV